MLDIFQNKKIYLYSQQIDFRKGIASLCYLIKTSYPSLDLSNSLFIFFSSDRKQVKMIEMVDKGVYLYQKRLSNHKFIFPKCDTSSVKIDSKQLNIILEAVEKISYRKR